MSAAFTEEQANGRPLIVCVIDGAHRGAARVPPNGDKEEARRRAHERAERKRVEAMRP